MSNRAGQSNSFCFKNKEPREFPGSPVGRLGAFIARAQVRLLPRELRPHRPCRVANKINIMVRDSAACKDSDGYDPKEER